MCFIVLACLFSIHPVCQEVKRVRELIVLTGDWNIDVEARLSMQGPWESSKAMSTIRFTLDSSLIEEDFAGTREGKPFLSKTLFAVNNMTGKFQRMFIDAPHGVLVDFEGVQSGDSLVFDKSFQYGNGNVVQLRVIYRILSDDRIVMESMRMAQNSPAWDVNARMRYTRVR